MAQPELITDELQSFEASLERMARILTPSNSDYRSAARIITEEISSTANIDRAGIWTFNENKTAITCDDLFEANKNIHGSGYQIPITQFPEYLSVVRSRRTHAITHIRDCAEIKGFADKYLIPKNVQSVISSALWHNDEMIGVIAGSIVGRPRAWSIEDKLYIASLSDIISRWKVYLRNQKNEPISSTLSSRRMVRELSRICSQKGFRTFEDAATTCLHSIKQFIGAPRAYAIILENNETYMLEAPSGKKSIIPKDITEKIYQVVSSHSSLWINNSSEYNGLVSSLSSIITPIKNSSLLISSFGQKPDSDQIRGVLIVEFHPPVPTWNEGSRNLILSAADALSILSEYAHTRQLQQESIAIARAAFQGSSVAMALVSRSGLIIKSNQALANFVAMRPYELSKMSIGQILPSLNEDGHILRSFLKSRSGKNMEFEETLVDPKTGENRWLLINISWVKAALKNRNYFLLQAVEITARKIATQELIRQKNFLRTIIDTDPNLIFAKDHRGAFTLANKAVACAYGTTPEEMLGKTDAFFNPNTAEVRKFREADQFVIDNNVELRNIEEELGLASGEVRYLQTVKRPIHDQDGKPIMVLGVATDITERKRYEEQYREWLVKLEHTQKLESLGILASGIAHDFNNLLLGILGNSALGLSQIREKDPAYQYILKSVSAAKKAAELTNQLLAYSGKGTVCKTELDLTELVRETTELLDCFTSRRISLEFSIDPDPLIIEADSGQLQQVIMNLITNAADALENRENATISIRTFRVMLTESPPDLCPDSNLIENGPYAVLEVEDNGCGMSPQIKGSIFDPFYTTKFTGRGLGLASVQGIVKAHSGALSVSTEQNKGSIFRVFIPIFNKSVDGSPTEPSVTVKNVLPKFKNNPILLIEDEAIPQEVCKLMLENLGFQVIVAQDGEEGLRLFRRLQPNLTAVVLDLTMPNVDGKEALYRIREIHPEIPVLLTSGYSEHGTVEDILSTQVEDSRKYSGFIQKPFIPSQLEEALASIITE
ncbi:MAG TPA: PAS domain S-box protein [Oligoflexia bacterium]|nr:PAS domain S-box protein [Oligoflexia bacterium]HMP48490.1 PAS domain S-box protein [Oligoflexia bacterium]